MLLSSIHQDNIVIIPQNSESCEWMATKSYVVTLRMPNFPLPPDYLSSLLNLLC